MAKGHSISNIAYVLGLHRSTVYRELKRNTLHGKPYCPETAQRMADLRNGDHAHKGGSPADSRTFKFRNRLREGLRTLLPALRKSERKSKKWKAWLRFCFRWKKSRNIDFRKYRLRWWRKESLRLRLRKWRFRFPQRYRFSPQASGRLPRLVSLSVPAQRKHLPLLSAKPMLPPPSLTARVGAEVNSTPPLFADFHANKTSIALPSDCCWEVADADRLEVARSLIQRVSLRFESPETGTCLQMIQSYHLQILLDQWYLWSSLVWKHPTRRDFI